MSLNYALGLGIKIVPKSLKVKLANNTVSENYGVTEDDVEVKIRRGFG